MIIVFLLEAISLVQILLERARVISRDVKFLECKDPFLGPLDITKDVPVRLAHIRTPVMHYNLEYIASFGISESSMQKAIDMELDATESA